MTFGPILPLIAVAADAIYLTITKIFLRRFGRFTSREFSWFLFAVIVIILILLMPWVGVMPTAEVITQTWWKLVIVAVLAASYNLLFYWGMEHEKISEIEPFLLFNPLAAILIAGMFYPSERHWQVYVAILVASIFLIWSHFHRHRVALSQGLWAILLFIGLHGLELTLIKQLLAVYSPLTLYLIRCSLILIILTGVVRPRLHLAKAHHWPWLGLTGLLAVVSVWASYTAFQLRGIAETLFVFTLSPVLVYGLSAIFLKEKWQMRNIIAGLVIVGLVIWITLLK